MAGTDFLNICSMDWVSQTSGRCPKSSQTRGILGNFIEVRRFLDPKKQMAVQIFSCMVVLVGYKSMGKDFIFRGKNQVKSFWK